jgi:hypothetical protein
MDEVITRVWQNLLDRVTGPMSFRVVMQPAVAALLAVRSGLQDARQGKPVFLWGLMTVDRITRRTMLRGAWKTVAKVFIFAVVLDVIYQIIVQRFVYPGETLLVAVLFAIVPYVAVRGIVNRLYRGRDARRPQEQS